MALAKLEEKLANIIIQKFNETYHFAPKVEVALGVARSLINEYKQHVEIESSALHAKGLEEAYLRYYQTTKLPEKDYRMHSAHFFKNFLYSHYTVILLKKDTWIEKIYWRLITWKKKYFKV